MAETNGAPAPAQESKLPWYFTKGSLVTAFVVVGPLALPLLWQSPNFSRTARWVWTVIVVGAVLTFIATPYLLRSLIR